MNVRNIIKIVTVIWILLLLPSIFWMWTILQKINTSEQIDTFSVINLGVICSQFIASISVFANIDATINFLSRFKFLRTCLHLEPLSVFAQAQSAWAGKNIGKALNLTRKNLRQSSGTEFALWDEWLETSVEKNVRESSSYLAQWGYILLLRAERQSAEKAQTTYLNLAQNELYPALVRAEAYRELAYLTMQHDPSEATKYLDQSETLYSQEPKRSWWESITRNKKREQEEMQIGRAQLQTVQAWYFAQQRQFGNAEKILQELKEKIFFDQPAWSEVVSMYYNAYSELAQKKGDKQKELEYQQKAYTYSENFPRRRVKYAHNLGERLMYKAYDTKSADTYEEADNYLESALQDALTMNDLELIALCYKTKGAWYALQGQHQQAVREYEKAEQRFEESNQQYSRALVSLDLAESYVLLKKCDFGRGYLQQAQEINEKLDSADVESQMEELDLVRLVRECG